MHWTPHSSLGAATIAFYSPALVACVCLLHFHGSPRMAWFFLTLMCVIRIASGVLVMLYESGGHYQTDLSTSASIVLGVGIFPLVFALVGWLYILYDVRSHQNRPEIDPLTGDSANIDDHQGRKWLRLSLGVMRVVGVAALAIIIAGSILLGPLDDSASGLRTGAALVKTGALLVVAILGHGIGWLIALWAELIQRRVRSRLLHLILSMLSLSAVLLVLRAVYMCLVIFNGGPNSIWNPLDGSLDVLVRMSLLPEYVIVVVMVATGFGMLKRRKVEKSVEGDVEVYDEARGSCHNGKGCPPQELLYSRELRVH